MVTAGYDVLMINKVVHFRLHYNIHLMTLMFSCLMYVDMLKRVIGVALSLEVTWISAFFINIPWTA